MGKKSKKNVLITDGGTIVSNKDIHSNIFVILCRALTIAIALLGVAALILGNL